MQADASNDELQTLQLRKTTEVLANMSVSKRNTAASASQDLQLITRRQRELDNEWSQSQTPQKPMEQGLETRDRRPNTDGREEGGDDRHSSRQEDQADSNANRSQRYPAWTTHHTRITGIGTGMQILS